MKADAGFTLLELMVAISVAGILLAVGIPSFSDSINRNQGVSDANSLLTVLTLARNEALSRDTTVTLCVSNDGGACDTATTATWDEGYLLYYKPPSGAAVTLKTEVPFSKSSGISASASFANAVSFNGFGAAGSVDGTGKFTGTTGTFKVLPKSLPATASVSLKQAAIRCVSLYQAGRVYIKKPDASFACS